MCVVKVQRIPTTQIYACEMKYETLDSSIIYGVVMNGVPEEACNTNTAVIVPWIGQSMEKAIGSCCW